MATDSEHSGEPDSGDPAPDQTPVDDDAPLGASSDVHQDLDPHDLPKDHPSRPAVEQAAEDRDDR